MQEGDLPLIPKGTCNHDTKGVIRDIFQDILCEPKYPRNIADNLAKNNVECRTLKYGALRTKTIIEESLLCVEDIEIAETKLMLNYGKHLVCEHKIKKDLSIKERRMLHRTPLYQDVDKVDANKYGLMSGNDLYPCKLITSMDFKINPRPHDCISCTSELDLIPSKLKAEKIQIQANRTVKFKPTTSDTHVEDNFRPSAYKIIFENYELNKTYKKKFKLQNISRNSGTFQIVSVPKTKYFQLEFNDTACKNKISSGMYVVFTVIFKTDIYLDVQDSIQFSSKGQRIEVAVVSYRNAPNLFMFIVKKTFPSIAQPQYDVARSIALNCDIDCEGCFLGEQLQLTLIIKNTGGHGKFFFVSEENWINGTITSLHDTLELEVGPFIIHPAYFEIDEQDYMMVLIEFYGEYEGLNIETVYLICNNVTFEIIDILADCIVYDEYCLKIVDSELLSIGQLRNLVCPEKLSSTDMHMYESSVKCIYMRNNQLVSGYNDPWEILSGEGIGSASTSEDNVQETNKDLVPVPTTEAILDYLGRIAIDTGEDGVKKEPVKVYGKYILYYGICRPCETNTRFMSVTNNCLLDIRYYWKKETSLSIGLDCADIYDMNHECVSVQKHRQSIFKAYSTTEFEIGVTPDSTDFGYYRMQLSLYAERIHRKAIPDHSKFILVQNEETCYYDILVAQFDIVCRIEEVIIEIIPDPILIDHEMVLDEEVDINLCFRIYTFDNSELYDCIWNINSDAVQIEPKELRPRENEFATCVLKVINRGYTDIKETIELIVNNIYKKTLVVSASVKRSLLKIIQPCLDFGVLQTGNTYKKIINIRNENCKRVNWDLWEVHDDKTMIKNETDLEVIHFKSGDLELHYIIKVTVKVDWVSTLYLYTINGDERNLESSCEIKYQSVDLQVYIHTPMSRCPILCPDELLFINIRSTYTLCIHNKSPLNTNFRFGEPYGDKEELATIEIVPNAGYLAADTIFRVSLHITPLIVGVLDEIFIPCYMENSNQDLYGDYSSEDLTVSVLCASENIFVRIKLPKDANNEGEDIMWPPQMIYEFDYNLYDVDPEQEVEHIPPYNSEVDMANNNFHYYDSPTNFDNITDYLNTIYTRMCGEATPPPFEASNFTSDSEFTELPGESLRDHFDSDFITQNARLEFYGVPVRTVATKTIVIQNVTPVWGDMNATVTNFPALETQVDKVQDIMVKMKMKKCNKWENSVCKEGVCFKVEYKDNQLEPFKSTTLTISVYANTWGIYADEITIDINNIVPFVITTIVEVVGLPLEFPIAINSTHKCPIFRFGVAKYMSDSITRKVYVKNTSVVPVSIVWHVFMRSKKDEEVQPITLLFDVFHPNVEEKLCNTDSLGGLAITHGNVTGTSESQIFKLLPKETYVKPGEVVYINVSFDPKVYVTSSQNTEVEAYLIGYVQLVEQFKSYKNMISRPTGSQMQPCKMKMTATLELPKLCLEVSGFLGFVYKATEAIDFIPYELTQILSFKNHKSVPAVVSFEVEEPMSITSIKTAELTIDYQYSPTLVNTGETIEVTITCKLDRSELFAAANTLYLRTRCSYAKRIDCDEMMYKYNRNLYIQQQGLKRQSLPFEISIYYPEIEATPEIDFGTVYVGNTKKQIFTLRNLRGSYVPFKILSSDELVVNPTSGVLPPAKIKYEHIDLSVIFIPNEYRAYNEEIIIKTNIPMYSIIVKAIGIGTHDQKYFVHEQC